MTEAEVEEVYYPLVAGDSGVSNLLQGRFYRLRFPKHKSVDELEWPGSVYLPIPGPEDVTHDGVSGLQMDRIQVDSWARTAKGARAVSRAILKSFKNTRRASALGFEIHHVVVEPSVPEYDNDRELYLDRQDILLYYRR